MFEFGDGSDDLEEHPSDGGGGVDALVQDDQVHATFLEHLGKFDEVFQRAPSLSSLVITSWSPARLVESSAWSSWGRRASFLEAVSRKTWSQPAAIRVSCCASGCCARVETRPYPMRLLKMYDQQGWALPWRVHGKRYKIDLENPQASKPGEGCLANDRLRDNSAGSSGIAVVFKSKCRILYIDKCRNPTAKNWLIDLKGVSCHFDMAA